MTIVAEKYDYVIGVDTHARTHTYAIVHAANGACAVTEAFPTTPAAIARSLAWAKRNTSGRVLAAVEGTSSYGAGLTRALTRAGIEVTEVKPPRKASRAGLGKSDPIDAVVAARHVLARDIAKLTTPRAEGIRGALRVLLTGRRGLDIHSTANRNALNALARTVDLGIDARKPLSNTQITNIAAWRPRSADTIEQRIARVEATRLATAIKAANTQLRDSKKRLAELCEQVAPGLQDLVGLGPVTAAILLTAYSHHGRIRSEAAFAALAGVSPLPASSGNTVRYRLNRHGDRQLNMALDVIVKVRMMRDDDTKRYVARRTAEGKNYREIKRILKRYVARNIYRQLQTLMP